MRWSGSRSSKATLPLVEELRKRPLALDDHLRGDEGLALGGRSVCATPASSPFTTGCDAEGVRYDRFVVLESDPGA